MSNDLKIRAWFDDDLVIPSPAVVGGDTIVSAGIGDTAGLGQPTIKLVVSSAGIADTAGLGGPAVKLVVSSSGIADTAALGQPSVRLTISSAGIADTAGIGLPTLTPTVLSLGISDLVGLGQGVVTAVIGSAGIADTAALGLPTVAEVVGDTIFPAGISTTAGLGQPDLIVIIQTAGFSDTAVVGDSAVSAAIQSQGIGTVADLGRSVIGEEFEAQRRRGGLPRVHRVDKRTRRRIQSAKEELDRLLERITDPELHETARKVLPPEMAEPTAAHAPAPAEEASPSLAALRAALSEAERLVELQKQLDELDDEEVICAVA